MNWWDRAACRGMDPELFFPAPPTGRKGSGDSAFQQRVEDAKVVCARCPVPAECLDEATRLGDVGIRGGQLLLDRPNRRQLREHAS